ncbi:MAG: preprotein translocase subunit SecY [Candidatus Aenigmarchaeota archaeon]|nr:preprotein translocase subunit SecY [Candidatus Aenigmarchaeota archaeon]
MKKMKVSFEWEKLAKYVPTIKSPVQKLSLKTKLKWTAVILILYFAMSHIRVFGVGNVSERYRTLEILLGSKFGTLMTLGIGPIVTASILLQLMVGSKIIEWDMNKPEDRRKYEAANKLLSIVFIVFEASAYVLAGAIPPASNDPLTLTIVISQIALGGFLVFLMDDLTTKWGIGSGISLFIAAGVTGTIFIRAFTPFAQTCNPAEGFSTCIPSEGNPPGGLFWNFLIHFISGDFQAALIFLIPLVSTVLVFLITMYAQDISVDIPLAFSAVRGFGRRWGLKLFYTSNIPIILTAALLANIQLWGKMGMDPETRCSWLACFDENNNPISGVLFYLTAPRGVKEIELIALTTGGFFTAGVFFSLLFYRKNSVKIITAFTILGFLVGLGFFFLMPDFFSFATLSRYALPFLTYTVFMITFAVIFSVFWVNTAGMDPESIAEQIESIGMQIPGYRRDRRIIKKVLERYIPPLAVIGGIAIGLLAAFADFTGALGTGTGILLTVSIIYNFYERIKAEHPHEAAPIIERILGKG